MTAESTRASMCLGIWAKHGLVDKAVMVATSQLPEVDEPDEQE